MPVLTTDQLASVMRSVQDASYLDVLILEHCGEIAIEHYANGYTATRLHDMQSATKTVPGLLVGIAIDQGLIKSVDQPIRELLTEHADLLTGGKANITVRHLLEMTSGLKWIDFGPERSFEKQAAAADSVAFILGEPLVSNPGKTWFYNTGSSHLLSAIVRKVSGKSTGVFAETYLFGPLDFGEYQWGTHADGTHEGGWQLYLRPVDALKLGQLLLAQGTWKGQQIISSAFIENAMTYRHGTQFPGSGYGFQMWIETAYGVNKLAGARGWGGQNILVAPDEHLILVTGGSVMHPAEMAAIVQSLMGHIAPALR
ncbi:MAG: serine hydrolase [Pseudomonadota bacterium]